MGGWRIKMVGVQKRKIQRAIPILVLVLVVAQATGEKIKE